MKSDFLLWTLPGHAIGTRTRLLSGSRYAEQWRAADGLRNHEEVHLWCPREQS